MPPPPSQLRSLVSTRRDAGGPARSTKHAGGLAHGAVVERNAKSSQYSDVGVLVAYWYSFRVGHESVVRAALWDDLPGPVRCRIFSSGSPGAAAIFAMVLAKSVFVVLVTLLCTLRCGVHGEGGPAGGGAILAMRGEG